MGEAVAAIVEAPVMFVLGWWARNKWERYPWNAKPQRWAAFPPLESTSAEALRAGPVGQFERDVAERAAVWAEALRPAFELALSAADGNSVIAKLSDGEIWVPEDCAVPDETLRAVNAPVILPPHFGKAADGE